MCCGSDERYDHKVGEQTLEISCREMVDKVTSISAEEFARLPSSMAIFFYMINLKRDISKYLKIEHQKENFAIKGRVTEAVAIDNEGRVTRQKKGQPQLITLPASEQFPHFFISSRFVKEYILPPALLDKYPNIEKYFLDDTPHPKSFTP